MAEPVLNLDTLAERRVVRIDGADYELLNVGEISVLHYHQIAKRAERVRALVDATDHTDEQVAELAALLDWLCRLLLKAPDAVHSRLTDAHRLAIVQTFSNLQRGSATAPVAEEGAPSTGGKPSRDSSASTAARRRTGSAMSHKL